jgi:hypothetical protein
LRRFMTDEIALARPAPNPVRRHGPALAGR